MGTRLEFLKRWITHRLPWPACLARLGAGRRKPPPPPIVPRPELWPKVREILVDNIASLRRSEVVPEARLAEDLGMDSGDAIGIVVDVEEELGIKIPDEEAERIATVQDLLRCIEEKLQRAQRPDRAS